MLNQAGALIHIYTDGSVSVSTGAVEMGQGVLTKLRRMVALALGISESRVRLESTNTSRVANMSPTAASTGADLNGGAALNACRLILERLKQVAADLTASSPEQINIRNERVWVDEKGSVFQWNELIQTAYAKRVDLSAHAFYATPNIDYDKQNEKGRPFAYHVRGAAIVEARLDVLRATAAIDAVRIIHDAGRSLDPLVDQGQVEGAVVQGIGWMTIEELVYDTTGRLLSDSPATYKVPDLHFIPRDIEVVFMEDSEDPAAVMHTKAIGEPPFMYGIGAYFAIRDAVRAVRDIPFDHFRAPLTNEYILELLEGPKSGKKSRKKD
ncbi:MAG: molybdopterin-dependent oxidoreductase, partial [Desulfobulbaceae bacterium]|nr:molybdopterin-dependent oxidoreductase [Desulfobulbaceae bacterium]